MPLDGVPRAYTCDQHAEMTSKLGEHGALLRILDDRTARIENKLDRIGDRVAAQSSEIAGIKKDVEHEAVSSGRVWGIASGIAASICTSVGKKLLGF